MTEELHGSRGTRERPNWLRIADAAKAAFSLTCTIMLYVYFYGNSGWNLPGPGILCFVVVFCDSHIESFEAELSEENSAEGDTTDGICTTPLAKPVRNWWDSPKKLKALQMRVLRALFYGGVQRLLGTLAAAVLGYITFLLSSNAIFCLCSLNLCILLFAFLRTYHAELFPQCPISAHSPGSVRFPFLVDIMQRLNGAGHAVGVACFYGCFFLVGIIHPSISTEEIFTRVVKNFIAVVVYWIVSLLYSLFFLHWN